MLLHVSVNKLSSGSLLTCFAEVRIIKIDSKLCRYEISLVVWLHIYPVLCVLCPEDNLSLQQHGESLKTRTVFTFR
jgi:hypothetical protein